MAQLQLPGLEGGGPGFLQGLLGNNVVETIFTWQVAAQLLAPLLQPYIIQLSQTMLASHPEVVIPPAGAADMVLRGWLDEAAGATEAAGSGINAERFRLLVNNTGEPPGIETVMEMLRRGIVPESAAQGEPSLDYAIRTSRVRDEWIAPLQQLIYAIPSPMDVIDAAVEDQIDSASARELFAKAGMDPQYFDLLFNTRGRPPGPGELGDAANRGFIPWEGTGPEALSFQQGIAESAVKTKWTETLRRLAAYHPPPRTVTALLREGAVTEAEALTLFQESGLPTNLAAAYVASAAHQKVQVDKDLAKTEVLNLYESRAITQEQALGLLDPLGYRGQTAAFIIELADMRRESKFLEAAIGRIRTLYVARKITAETATGALDTLGVPADQRDHLMALWQLERTSTVRILTEAQIVDAWNENVIDQDTAETELQAIGYTPFDAWVLLSIKNKGALPNPPARGPSPAGNIT